MSNNIDKIGLSEDYNKELEEWFEYSNAKIKEENRWIKFTPATTEYVGNKFSDEDKWQLSKASFLLGLIVGIGVMYFVGG